MLRKLAILVACLFALAVGARAQSNAAPSLRYGLNICTVTTVYLSPGSTQSLTLRGNCNIPSDRQVTAADLVLLVQTASAGTLRLWEEGLPEPAAKIADFGEAGDFSVSVAPRFCAPFMECGPDLKIKSSAFATVTINVQGYFAESP